MSLSISALFPLKLAAFYSCTNPYTRHPYLPLPMHVQCQATRSAVERQGRAIECTKVTQYASYSNVSKAHNDNTRNGTQTQISQELYCNILPQITTLLQKHSASRQSHSYTQALHFAMMFICLPAIGPRQIDNYRYGHTRRKKGERNRLIRHRTAVILLWASV